MNNPEDLLNEYKRLRDGDEREQYVTQEPMSLDEVDRLSNMMNEYKGVEVTPEQQTALQETELAADIASMEPNPEPIIDANEEQKVIDNMSFRDAFEQHYEKVKDLPVSQRPNLLWNKTEYKPVKAEEENLEVTKPVKAEKEKPIKDEFSNKIKQYVTSKPENLENYEQKMDAYNLSNKLKDSYKIQKQEANLKEQLKKRKITQDQFDLAQADLMNQAKNITLSEKSDIEKIQKDYGVKIDGKVGPETMGVVKGTELAKLLIEKGYPKEQAAAIAGNLAYETMGFLKLEEINENIYGTKGLGFSQWTDTKASKRRTEFEKFSKERGLDPKSNAASTAFLLKDLEGKHWTGEKLEGFLKQKNINDATNYFRKRFLRPAKSSKSEEGRRSYANKIFSNLKEKKKK